MKKLALAGVLVAVLIVPPPAFALSPTPPTDEQVIAGLKAQIQALLAQVQQLQAKLAQVEGEKPFCHNWTQNLRVGDGGQGTAEGLGTRAPNSIDADGHALLKALSKEGLFDYDQNVGPGSAGSSLRATYFSERVASAIVVFQEKYASEILIPSGLKRGTGYVGPATRKVLNRLYGCNVPVTSLKERVYNGNVAGLKFVNGKAIESSRCGPIPNDCIASAELSGYIEGDLNQDGINDALVNIRTCGASCGVDVLALSGNGLIVIPIEFGNEWIRLEGKPYPANFKIFSGGFTFDVNSYMTGDVLKSGLLVKYDAARKILREVPVVSTQSSITILSPNGGEYYTAETPIPIRWKSNGAIEYVTITANHQLSEAGASITLESKLKNSGNYFWAAPKSEGKYSITVKPYALEYGGDTSDAPFTITTSSALSCPSFAELSDYVLKTIQQPDSQSEIQPNPYVIPSFHWKRKQGEPFVAYPIIKGVRANYGNQNTYRSNDYITSAIKNSANLIDQSISEKARNLGFAVDSLNTLPLKTFSNKDVLRVWAFRKGENLYSIILNAVWGYQAPGHGGVEVTCGKALTEYDKVYDLLSVQADSTIGDSYNDDYVAIADVSSDGKVYALLGSSNRINIAEYYYFDGNSIKLISKDSYPTQCAPLESQKIGKGMRCVDSNYYQRTVNY